jgi:hypothetical protein
MLKQVQHDGGADVGHDILTPIPLPISHSQAQSCSGLPARAENELTGFDQTLPFIATIMIRSEL